MIKKVEKNINNYHKRKPHGDKLYISLKRTFFGYFFKFFIKKILHEQPSKHAILGFDKKEGG